MGGQDDGPAVRVGSRPFGDNVVGGGPHRLIGHGGNIPSESLKPADEIVSGQIAAGRPVIREGIAQRSLMVWSKLVAVRGASRGLKAAEKSVESSTPGGALPGFEQAINRITAARTANIHRTIWLFPIILSFVSVIESVTFATIIKVSTENERTPQQSCEVSFARQGN